MNVRLLKAKRVERGFLQKDLAKALGITEKAMCQKECSPVCRFKAEEMLTLAGMLKLTPDEFDAIFFDHQLSKRLNFLENRGKENEPPDSEIPFC